MHARPCSAHAQIFCPWMSTDRGDVIAIEQRVQHAGRQRHYIGLVVGPDKTACFKAFRHQPEATSIPTDKLDPVTTAVSEDIKRGVHRVQMHGLLDENREAVHAVAEIDRIAVQVHFQVFVEPEHGILPRIWISVVSSSMVAMALPISSSTPLASRTCSA